MTDRNLYLILRIMQNRTELPLIIRQPQYIWHRRNNNGKSQITYECSADTLAGKCHSPRASARRRGQCAFAHAEASIESIAYTPHVIPGPSIPLSSPEDVSRTANLFPLPPCYPMIRRSILPRSFLVRILYRTGNLRSSRRNFIVFHSVPLCVILCK